LECDRIQVRSGRSVVVVTLDDAVAELEVSRLFVPFVFEHSVGRNNSLLSWSRS
jgi:hypothetical protein